MSKRPEVVYAIGDVHGRWDLLRKLEAMIVEDSAGIDGAKFIIMLGDYVDRGPQSREVIEHLQSPPPKGFQRLCLAGNHEEIMAAFLNEPASASNWLEFGGRETLASYGIYEDSYAASALNKRSFMHVLQSSIPEEHIQFLEGLPAMITMPGYVFVHAGIRPLVSLENQSDHDLLWIRREFLDAADLGLTEIVVHGHTPVPEPEVLHQRIGIDTGAYMTGCLTAVRINETDDISFCFAR